MELPTNDIIISDDDDDDNNPDNDKGRDFSTFRFISCTLEYFSNLFRLKTPPAIESLSVLQREDPIKYKGGGGRVEVKGIGWSSKNIE